ncbi:60S ribosomal protein L6, mitochondrial, partial [Linum perenne]
PSLKNSSPLHRPPLTGRRSSSPFLPISNSAGKQMEAKFFRFLKIVGVGYKARAESEGRLLFLKLGYSHEVELTVPPAVRVFCFKNNVVCCTGIDKQRVHQFAATVRSCKPPEVYKGKGIMYNDEVIKKKQGKKSK